MRGHRNGSYTAIQIQKFKIEVGKNMVQMSKPEIPKYKENKD